MVRCFAALPIPEGTRRTLERALEGYREKGWPVRWVRSEGIHITLKFFGEVPRDRVDAIAESIDFARDGIGPLGLTLRGFGAFPANDRPRVLWAGVEAPAALELLQDRVETRADTLGFPGEVGIYRPHVTVGRVREGERIPRAEAEALFAEPLESSFSADRVVLYESTLGPGGSTYTSLHEAMLT